MKHHLNVILIALRIIIVVAACMAGYNFICCGAVLIYPEEATGFLNRAFTPIAPYKYGAFETQFMPWYFGGYGVLLCYFTYVLKNLRKCFVRLKKGTIFYKEQVLEFKRAGGGIIIFAKCRYLLMCGFGAIFFKAPQLFITEIPVFLMLYLIGKMVLVLHYMAQKGTFLREENDLTI